MNVSLKVYLYVVRILMCESTQGYDSHKYIAIGLLNYLADVLTPSHTSLANDLRSVRILILDDLNTAFSLLDALLDSSTITVTVHFNPMLREACYDCCIKHLTTAAVYSLSNNTDAAIANLIEALNEAPISTDDYIKVAITDLIRDPSSISVNIWGLIEVVDAERTKNGM